MKLRIFTKPFCIWSLFAASFLGAAIQANEIPFESIGKITMQSRGVQKTGTGILLLRPGYFLTSLHNITYCFQEWRIPVSQVSENLIGRSCRRNVKIEFPHSEGAVQVNEFVLVNLGSLQLTDQNTPYRDWVLLRLEHPALRNFRYPRIFLDPMNLESGMIKVLGFPQVAAGERVYLESVYSSSTSALFPADRIGLRETQGFLRSRAQTENLWRKLYGELGLSETKLSWLFNLVSRNFFRDSANLFYHAALSQGYSGGPIFDSDNRLIGINWGSLSVWSRALGPMPTRKLGLDSQLPSKDSNGLAAGQSLKVILDKIVGRTR